LIISVIGKNNTIGLKVNNNFFFKDYQFKNINSDSLLQEISDFISENKVIIDSSFSVLVNIGPGSFSLIRTALAIAKGISLAKEINLFGFKNSDLDTFTLENIEFLIKKKKLQNKLIKPVYELN
tara:strand:- start:200 stop:571 length:372 start_codon:yes stop_codon:yes gene_type:complete